MELHKTTQPSPRPGRPARSERASPPLPCHILCSGNRRFHRLPPQTCSRERYRMAAVGSRYDRTRAAPRSEEHTSELQSLMRISYAVFCLKKKKNKKKQTEE